MILDNSAVVAVLFNEKGSSRLRELMMTNPCAMSAATRVELGIVIEAKKGPAGTQLLDELLSRVAVRTVPVDEAMASEAILAWREFGKGRHPAALNLGDTFSYALARLTGEPLLYTGDDFARTDIDTP